MNIFKESLNDFKKLFFKLSITELLFFVLIVLSFVFIQDKVNNYILESQSYSNLLESNLENIIEASTNLEFLNNIVQKAYVYSFIIFPIIIFILYILFQGLSYYLLKRNLGYKKNLFLYLFKFLFF